MKKILVLTSRFPYPVVGGDKLRIYNICKELSRNHHVSLLSLCEKKEELTYTIPDDGVFGSVHRVYLPKWRSYLNCLFAIPTKTPLQIAYYSSRSFARLVNSLCKENDVVLSHLIRTASYLGDIGGPTKVLEMTDAISMNYKRVRSTPGKLSLRSLIYGLEYERLNEFEKSICSNFDLSVLVSGVDRDYLFSNHDAAEKNIRVCSNGVDFDRLPFNYNSTSNTIVFIGNMYSIQNFDAALWFASEVMPKLLEKGEYVFKVVGKIRARQKKSLERFRGVKVTGSVDSISDAVRGALVGVCPVRLAAGVQNKTLEYMSLGLPAISSRVGYEGISAEIGKEVLIADSVDDHLFVIEKLVSDRNYAASISKAGRNYVELNHNWSEVLKPLTSYVDEVPANT